MALGTCCTRHHGRLLSKCPNVSGIIGGTTGLRAMSVVTMGSALPDMSGKPGGERPYGTRHVLYPTSRAFTQQVPKRVWYHRRDHRASCDERGDHGKCVARYVG